MSLSVSWIRPGGAILVRWYCFTYGAYRFSIIPYDSSLSYDTAVELLCSGKVSELGDGIIHYSINDEPYNFIETTPGLDGDNNCYHFSVQGTLSLNKESGLDRINLYLKRKDEFKNEVWALEGYPKFEAWTSDTRYSDSKHRSYSTIAGDLMSFTAFATDGRSWEAPGSGFLDSNGKIKEVTDYPWGQSKYSTQLKKSMCKGVVVQPFGFDDLYLRKQYSSMIQWFHRCMAEVKLHGNEEFLASQEAALSYKAYDINLVETAFDLKSGLSAFLPSRTADDLIRLLDNSRYTTLPSKIVDAASSLSGAYLYKKYAIDTSVSDLKSLTVGDSDVSAEHVNHALQCLAEQLVYKGTKSISRYGHIGYTDVDSRLGEYRVDTNARLRAYPKYLKDMSDAAIIVENIGLALSAERLAQVIPYEFVAEWFLPIEESIRSIEYNHARLNSMWELQGLCLSTKIRKNLGDLRYNFGFSEFSGDLEFILYSRHTDGVFPSTSLPSVGPSDINPSRIMQGTALIIS